MTLYTKELKYIRSASPEKRTVQIRKFLKNRVFIIANYKTHMKQMRLITIKFQTRYIPRQSFLPAFLEPQYAYELPKVRRHIYMYSYLNSTSEKRIQQNQKFHKIPKLL